MISIIPLDISVIEPVVVNARRDQLEYFEYDFLSDGQLRSYKKSSLLKLLESSESLCLVARSANKISGIISMVKDQFDSEMFGYDCYRLSIQVFSEEYEEIRDITIVLLKETEEWARVKSGKFYISTSLNNNTLTNGLLFNCLTENGFYYIHTLLTFKSDRFPKIPAYRYPGQLIIRKAIASDAGKVSELAQNSFRYSRFHLDPFLEADKSNLLLKISAENSILKNFVDVMFVAELKGEVVGYYSAKKKMVTELSKTIGEVVISAVNSDYRGMGIFSNMDDHILKWFSDNCDFAEMGTYLANYPVHKTWIKKNLGLIRGIHQFSKKVI